MVQTLAHEALHPRVRGSKPLCDRLMTLEREGCDPGRRGYEPSLTRVRTLVPEGRDPRDHRILRSFWLARRSVLQSPHRSTPQISAWERGALYVGINPDP